MEKLFLMQQILTTLFATTNKLQIQGDKHTGELTSRQLIAMLAIAHIKEGEASYNKIGEKLGTTKQNVKQIIMSLEKKKFVTVKASIIDKRAVDVRLTKLGKCVTKASGRSGNIFLEEVAASFSREELEMLWKLLKKLYVYDQGEMSGFEELADF